MYVYGVNSPFSYFEVFESLNNYKESNNLLRIVILSPFLKTKRG